MMMTRRILAITAFLTVCLYVKAQLPAVTLGNVSGNLVRVDTLSNDGRPIVIDFFATWCKPCIRELDAINDVYDDWKDETGMKLIAVSIDQAQNIHKVKPLVDQAGWQYDVLLDPNGDLKRALGIQLIPYTLVIDGKGKIVYRHQGYADGAEEELIDEIRRLVNP
jgi:peroxiredoxin